MYLFFFFFSFFVGIRWNCLCFSPVFLFLHYSKWVGLMFFSRSLINFHALEVAAEQFSLIFPRFCLYNLFTRLNQVAFVAVR